MRAALPGLRCTVPPVSWLLSVCKPSPLSQASLLTASNPLGQMQRLTGSPFLQPLGVDLAKQTSLAALQRPSALAPASPLPLGPEPGRSWRLEAGPLCRKGIRDLTWGGGTAPLRTLVFPTGWSNDSRNVRNTPALSDFYHSLNQPRKANYHYYSSLQRWR